MSAGADKTKRKRGRPRLSEGALVSRETITRTALAIAGAEGFHALSMHRLARELEVTPKALYNHVRDRQEVIDAVASLMMQELPAHDLDTTDWRVSLRAAYSQAREAYRRFPRATLISMDETVTAREVNPLRIELTESMLQFFVDIGLTLEQAISARGAFLTDVFGFVLTVDYRYDIGNADVREAIPQPVPRVWLDAHPEIPAPLSRQAAALPTSSSDEIFNSFVDLRLAAIEALRSGNSPA